MSKWENTAGTNVCEDLMGQILPGKCQEAPTVGVQVVVT